MVIGWVRDGGFECPKIELSFMHGVARRSKTSIHLRPEDYLNRFNCANSRYQVFDGRFHEITKSLSKNGYRWLWFHAAKWIAFHGQSTILTDESSSGNRDGAAHSNKASNVQSRIAESRKLWESKRATLSRHPARVQIALRNIITSCSLFHINTIGSTRKTTTVLIH